MSASPDASIAGGEFELASASSGSHAWQPIETAPKDGRWFLAFRPTATVGKWQTLCCVCWNDACADFVWPCETFDYYAPPGIDERDDEGFFVDEVFESGGSFTHWMPLPEPPAPSTNEAPR